MGGTIGIENPASLRPVGPLSSSFPLDETAEPMAHPHDRRRRSNGQVGMRYDRPLDGGRMGGRWDGRPTGGVGPRAMRCGLGDAGRRDGSGRPRACGCSHGQRSGGGPPGAGRGHAHRAGVAALEGAPERGSNRPGRGLVWDARASDARDAESGSEMDSTALLRTRLYMSSINVT